MSSLAKPPFAVLAFLGHGRCGKDTAGEYIAANYAVRFAGGCSWAGCPYVAERLGISVEEAWATRHQRRMEWYELLNEYRKDDPARLIRKVLETSDFVCGVRDDFELLSAKKENLLDLLVWIERPGIPNDPTLKFTAADCDIVIHNDSTKEGFHERLGRLANALHLPERCS